MKTFRILIVLALATGFAINAQDTVQVTAQTDCCPCTPKITLASYKKYAPIAALATLGSGLLLKNGVLTGMGVGTLTGMGTAMFEKDAPWIMLWLAETSARWGLAPRLNVGPDSIKLTAEEIEKIENEVRKEIRFIPFSFLSEQAKEESKKEFEQMRNAIADLKKENLKVVKAYAPYLSASWFASWSSYLMFKYLERKQAQQA